MNVDTILNYKADPNEDYYGLLGCHPSASTSQIMAEFKARARDYHPDKNVTDSQQSQEKFQLLLRAKEALTDEKERRLYDAWRSANIAMTYAQWRGLKDSVKSSMHWATPKTSGRMLDISVQKEEEPLSLNPSPVKEDDLLVDEAAAQIPDPEEDGIDYDPTPYEKLGLRVSTPPLSIFGQSEESKSTRIPVAAASTSSSGQDPVTAMRRRQFAVRRQSTIGAMVMAEKWEDNEIRRRFRNYEI